MLSALRLLAPPHPCGYLADQTAQLEYDFVAEMTAAEYQQRLLEGWRRFGHSTFRPRCTSCHACQSLRIVVERSQPNRSQHRVRQRNAGQIELRIGSPSVTGAKLQLYDRFHAYQAVAK